MKAEMTMGKVMGIIAAIVAGLMLLFVHRLASKGSDGHPRRRRR